MYQIRSAKRTALLLLTFGICVQAQGSIIDRLRDYKGAFLSAVYKKPVIDESGSQGTDNGLFSAIEPTEIFAPTTIQQTCSVVKSAHERGCKVSIAGARQSRGNQVSSTQPCMMIDTKHLNKIVAIDAQKNIVTVQAGITWRNLEDVLHQHGLSVITRQSYIDFSVGGSIGVNIHGQNIHETMLYDTVETVKVILADGSLVVASRTENPTLFNAVIGGYGLFGLVVEATLRVTQDCWLRMNVQRMKTKKFKTFFDNEVKNNHNVHFYSARLSINPNALFDELISIMYAKDHIKEEPLEELKNPQSFMDRSLLHLIRKNTVARKIRLPVEEKMLNRVHHTSRNNALRESIENLLPLNNSRDCLQEYFVPCDNIMPFLKAFKKIVLENNVNLMNVTIRYVKAHANPLLTYASKECFAFVIYYNIKHAKAVYEHTEQWTQRLIDVALNLGGSFYLPYELLATQEQVHRAYPKFLKELHDIKKQYDPAYIFTNALFEKYTTPTAPA